jgi:hypothetical protein
LSAAIPDTGARHLDLPKWGLLPYWAKEPTKAQRPIEAHTPERDLLIRAIIRGVPRGGIGQNLGRKRCARRRTA